MPVISTWGSLSARAFGFGAVTAASTARALWAWGDNTAGQLGLGNTTSYSSPKQVGALTDWASLSAAAGNGSLAKASVLAVKNDGTLWAWGNNNKGQLGLGNITDYSSPKQVGTLTNWSNVSIGFGRTSAAVKTDGTLWTWGYGYGGGLGLGNTASYSSPKQVGALTNWSSVSTGQYFVTAVKTDGTLWSWGRNNYGQLGRGNTTAYSSPKQIGALSNWSKVSSIGASTVAVKTDGTIWSWGQGNSGNLGQGNSYSYSSPKQIGSLTNWSKIGGGMYFATAVKTDGTLWAWGSGTSGALGNGGVAGTVSPIQVGALTTWLIPLSANGAGQVANGGQAAGAIKTDGTLWVWGNNNKGQLGLGNTTNYSSPKQVGAGTTWKSAVTGSSMLAIKG